MADEIPISGLPAAASSALTDIFPGAKSGVTYKETLQQVLTLFNANILIGESQVTNLSSDLTARMVRANNLSDVSNTVTALSNIGALPIAGGTMTGNLILNANPTVALGAVTKQYADAIASGFIPHTAAAASTTANLNATYNNGSSGVGATLTNAGTQAAFSTDGVTPSINSRILVQFQSSQANNGIYTLTTVGTGASNWVLTRATDFDTATSGEVETGATIPVTSGTIYAGSTHFLSSPGPYTIGTTAIVFSAVSTPTNYIAGNGISIATNTISATINTTNLKFTADQIDTIQSIATNSNFQAATIKLTTGATNGYVLQSDASGNGTWTAPTATGVSSVTGTISQVLVNGIVGTPQTGAVTLTLPQNIATTSVPTFLGLITEGNYSTVSFDAFVYPVQFLQSTVIAPSALQSGAGVYIASTINAGTGSEVANFDSLLIVPSQKDGDGVIDIASGINVFAPSIGVTNFSARLNGDVQLNFGDIIMNEGGIAIGSSGDSLISGTIRTAPPDSETIIGSGFPATLIIGTPTRNTSGFDILVNVFIELSVAGTVTVSMGVGSTDTVSKNTAFSDLPSGHISLSAIVPNDYYLEIDITGSYSQANNVCATAI